MKYICPKCLKPIEPAAAAEYRYSISGNAENGKVFCIQLSCPSCNFPGIESIFIPDLQFHVYLDNEGYYVKQHFEVGVLRILKLYFAYDVDGKLHYTVSCIRAVTDIKQLAEALSSNNPVIRNEAKRKFDQLKGAT